jgi:hypothetical protein
MEAQRTSDLVNRVLQSPGAAIRLSVGDGEPDAPVVEK